MSLDSKKMAVLMALHEQADPISSAAVLTALKNAYAERSIRRWLSELSDAGFVEKIGVKRATTYTIAHNAKAKAALAYLQKPLYEREPKTYNATWLDAYQPNKTRYLSKEFSDFLNKKAARSINHEPAGTYAKKIYDRLLIDLAYNSSRLEGNTYSLLETEKLLMQGESSAGKLDEERIMILNHKEAIRYLVDHSENLEANVTTVCTLHYLLSDALVAHQHAGKMRDQGVRIGSSVYVPLDDPKALQEQLGIICHKAEKILDPFEKSFFMLVHIAYLQAFIDVNKRTSRLASNIPFIQNNLVPLSFNGMNREKYISALIAVYELNNTALLEEIYLQSYLRTCRQYDKTVETVHYDAIRVIYRSQRRALIKAIIQKKLYQTELSAFIQEYARNIPVDHQAAFIEKIHEDLSQLSLARVAGFGISQAELQDYLDAGY